MLSWPPCSRLVRAGAGRLAVSTTLTNGVSSLLSRFIASASVVPHRNSRDLKHDRCSQDACGIIAAGYQPSASVGSRIVLIDVDGPANGRTVCDYTTRLPGVQPSLFLHEKC